MCKTLSSRKVLDGYSLNICSLISMKDLRLIGLKSRDCHVLMQQLLLVALRAIDRGYMLELELHKDYGSMPEVAVKAPVLETQPFSAYVGTLYIYFHVCKVESVLQWN